MSNKNADNNTLTFAVEKLKQASKVFRAVNHPLRQKMLQFIHNQQGSIVTDIYKKLRLEQSVASQHLGVLRRESIVVTKRDGKKIIYNVNYERIQKIESIADELLKSSINKRP